ncbi:hypothetical protein HPULCUR_007451 [Helicostylum pulchrum]|uniref:SCP domain-containing protein n=1 Tax=Helicostylum pulchrum TaxID=562976 RepID=A0ABP9Y4T0_9FUNG
MSITSLFILTAEAGINAQDRQSVLSIHNRLRKTHNTPVLKWDNALAQQASKFTDECQFNRKNTLSLQNINALDNVAQGYGHWNQTIQAWYSGHKDYNFKSPGYTDDAGTFITMIWKDSARIGCSSNSCSSGNLYHCIYSPSIPTHLIFNAAEYKSNVLLKEQ